MLYDGRAGVIERGRAAAVATSARLPQLIVTTLRDHDKHKLGIIRTLLATYRDLPFVLVGDSGERDPEIYRQVVDENPGRIRAIYIRDVTRGERDAAVREIARELLTLGVEMLLAADTTEAARHAAANRLIAPDAPPAVL